MIEDYPPVSDWHEAVYPHDQLPLEEGEYTVIVDDPTGTGIYVVARLDGINRYTSYLDTKKMGQNFVRISSGELSKRISQWFILKNKVWW